MEKEGYWSAQLGFGVAKKTKKSISGHIKGAKLEKAPLYLREVRFLSGKDLPAIGEMIELSSVLQPGDIIDVSGISKGKGFAGGVKRYHFKGGPRTHGQSDRERAPGSIGQTTTPGRVYKGKRMAGKMGFAHVTVKNLTVADVDETTLSIEGLIPGKLGSLVKITKMGTNKKFVPLLKEEMEKREKEVKTEMVTDRKEEPSVVEESVQSVKTEVIQETEENGNKKG